MRRVPPTLRVVAVTSLAVLVLPACGDQDERVVPLPGCLDLAAVYALTGPESIGVSDWAEAAPLAEELGSAVPAADFPDAPLSIFGPGEESGTFDTFTELAIAEIAAERGIPEDEALPRPDYTSSPNDNVIIDGVSGSSGSFGWVGHAFARESDAVDTFAVAGADGRCVEPSDRAIASGEYVLARDLFVYVNVERAQEDDAVQAFVDLYLGDVGRRAVGAAGYVELTAAAWDETRSAWSELGGSPGAPAPDVEGEVLVSGSSTVEPISSAVAEAFSADNPSASVSVDGPGTGDGFELFCDGDIDIADASRPIDPLEAESCAGSGVEFVALKVGIDGLALVTRGRPDA